MRQITEIFRTAAFLIFLAMIIGCGGAGNENVAKHEHDDHEQSEARHEGESEHGEHGEEEGVVVLAAETDAYVSIRVAPAEEREILPVLRTTGRVGFDERQLAHVSPRVAGRVVRVDHELGDDVKAGDVLAILDSVTIGQAKANYLTARADKELASKTLTREEGLYEDKIASEKSVLEARAVYEKSLAMLRAAAERLRLLGLAENEIENIRYGDPEASLSPVRAPFDGRVVGKHLVLGELVSPEDNIFTVANLNRLWIWIDVFERDLAHVHRGDQVTVVTQAYPSRVFSGEVTYVRDEVDVDTRTARARIDIENPDRALKPGMFAEATLTDPHRAGLRPSDRHTGIVVPASAILREGDGWTLFVQEGERRYERREVALGVRTGEVVEVVTGVRVGEMVVIEGGFLLKSEIAKTEMGGGHSH